jgi:molybdate transport system substrate-binding protein
MRRLFAALAASLFTYGSAVGADLVVLVDEPARPAIVSVAEEFKRSSGHNLTFVFGAGPALNRRVMDGERADVIITPKKYVDELQAASKANAADARSIGGAGFSLAVRKGGMTFDVSTVDALRTALLKADAVVFNNLGSGNYFATVIDRLALSQAIAGKVVRLGPYEVFERVAKSSAAEIAVGTTPLVLEDTRLQLIGDLPPEFQSRLELFAMPLVGSQNRNSADALIVYLTAPNIRQQLAGAGLK